MSFPAQTLRLWALLLGAALPAAPAFAQAPPEAEASDEVEAIVVESTRSGRRLQDEPTRVEVIDREEIEEKILMAPGNIAMIVAETGGLRVQVASPSLGAANVRVQGMKGRYTQLLADGLPLYGGQAASIGLLQVAPTDLGQVEVIKGAASAFYGPSALGGVVNLISRRPGPEREVELLANLTSRNGQDLTAYGSTPLGKAWRGSLVGGLHRQGRRDLDGDGWIDMPGYDRWTLRPRLFWTGLGGASVFLTLGAMDEERTGGTLPGRAAADGRPFVEAQASRRRDAGLVARLPLSEAGALQFRASAMRQGHDHRFGEVSDTDRHETYFAEAAYSGARGTTSWLAGLALQEDGYRSKTFRAFNYRFRTPAAFAQVETDAMRDLTLAASARLDAHSEYGTRFSPRLSALWRPGRWTVRASLGRGFYAPTPFVEEIEATGLSRLQPLAGLKAETATTAALEGGYRYGPWEATVTLFHSDIRDAVQLVEAGSRQVQLVTARGPTRTSGAEALLRYKRREITVTGSYVHVDATEPDPAGLSRRVVPRTPHHTAGIVAVWERADVGRLGFEAYYTGRQSLDDNPFRNRSRPYVEVGILGELVLGKARLFLNLENILNVRQTRYDPLVLPRRAPSGRWTVDAWAPADGFVANAGIKLRFGGA